MAVKTYTWVTLWFFISSLVVFWDAGYLFLRFVSHGIQNYLAHVLL